MKIIKIEYIEEYGDIEGNGSCDITVKVKDNTKIFNLQLCDFRYRSEMNCLLTDLDGHEEVYIEDEAYADFDFYKIIDEAERYAEKQQ